MKTTDLGFKEGRSDKGWFKKGHKLSPESIEKMRRAKTKYTPQELIQRKKDRAKNPDRIAWINNYKKTPKRLYSTYKRSADFKHFIFDLTYEQFMSFWQKPCSYCQDKIETIGIDRLDSKNGYTISNCISCCKICNYMKRDLVFQDFLYRCEKISRNHNPFLF